MLASRTRTWGRPVSSKRSSAQLPRSAGVPARWVHRPLLRFHESLHLRELRTAPRALRAHERVDRGVVPKPPEMDRKRLGEVLRRVRHGVARNVIRVRGARLRQPGEVALPALEVSRGGGLPGDSVLPLGRLHARGSRLPIRTWGPSSLETAGGARQSTPAWSLRSFTKKNHIAAMLIPASPSMMFCMSLMLMTFLPLSSLTSLPLNSATFLP